MKLKFRQKPHDTDLLALPPPHILYTPIYHHLKNPKCGPLHSRPTKSVHIIPFFPFSYFFLFFLLFLWFFLVFLFVGFVLLFCVCFGVGLVVVWCICAGVSGWVLCVFWCCVWCTVRFIYGILNFFALGCRRLDLDE